MAQIYSSIAEAFPVFLNSLLDPQMIFALVFGIIGGMIMGALPGLSGTMAVALMIPFTYAMRPIPALTMLCAIYTSAITGGGFSAILIHTPGTPASAATLFDGYPMAQNGHPRRALGISLYSSVFGGVLSVIALLLLAPPLARVTLMFSSPEYFLLGCFGISIIASLASESLAKGLVSGVLGILISTVGGDAMSAYPRFTFGNMYLLGGIQSAAVMIGLFSISQVMMQAVKPRLAKADDDINKERIELGDRNLAKDGRKDSVILSFKDLKSLFVTMFRSAIIGIGCGILPGAGGSIAGWMAYNEAKRFSKNKEKFGTGCDEGLAASESANNAVTGGGLIPLLTLGVPGTPTAAILLGGLMIQGLRPGAELFTTQATITYSFIFGFLLASIAMFFIGLVFCKYVANVTRVPLGILTPIIVVLSVVGTFSIAGVMYNVHTMIVFGLVGFIMRKAGFHPAAFTLGLILGYITEGGLRRAIVMARGDVIGYFLGRPISVMLIIITVITLSAPLIKKIREYQKSNHSTSN